MAKNKKPHLDYVKGLLTGRFEKVKNSNGKIREEFVPTLMNKYPPLHVLYNNNPELSRNEIMFRQSLIHGSVSIDRNEFKKTDVEKAALKKIKRDHKNSLKEAGFNPKKRLNITKPTLLRV